MHEEPVLTDREAALREDLAREYYALQNMVAAADERMMSVKGWSVTLSLAALGLGFQTAHYSLFGICALTAAGFWLVNVLVKGHQYRFWGRIREIEVISYELNRVSIPSLGYCASSPRINWSWANFGSPDEDNRSHDGQPVRYTKKQEIRRMRRRFILPNVCLPHVVAIALGVALFTGAAMEVAWLPVLPP